MYYRKDMDNRRTAEKNKIRDEIRRTESYIENDKKSIERLRQQTINIEYAKNSIEKLKNKNIDRQEGLLTLQQRLKDVDTGIIDNELNDVYKHNKEEIRRKNQITREKKEHELEIKKGKIIQSKKFYESTRSSDQKSKQLVREIDRTYKYYLRSSSTIPDYMLKKLKEMPNNKGYIWRGIQCYGELPEEPGQPLVMFEKNKDLMIIHEWTDSEYKMWHKKGKGRKTLQHFAKIHRENETQSAIYDYIK